MRFVYGVLINPTLYDPVPDTGVTNNWNVPVPVFTCNVRLPFELVPLPIMFPFASLATRLTSSDPEVLAHLIWYGPPLVMYHRM